MADFAGTQVSSQKVSSFTAKNAYDEVFGGGIPSFSSRVEDYTDIFSSRNSSSRVSSIPFLDLPVVDDFGSDGWSSSKFDYSEIFGGGFDSVDYAIPYEELFLQPKSGEGEGEGLSDGIVFPSEVSSEDPVCSETNEGFSNIESHYAYDCTKQFNVSYHKTNQVSKEDGISGATHIAQLNAIPAYTFVVDESLPLHTVKCDNSLPEVANNKSLKGNTDLRKDGEHFAETMPPQLACGSSQKSQKYFDVKGISDKNLFPTLTEVGLKTNPTEVPPPTRQPPKVTIKQGSHKLMSSDLKSSTKYARQPAAAPVSFDGDIDSSSSAAASVAAMKEAMEIAQARLKSAKELMERKKDGLQNRKNMDMRDAKPGGSDARNKEEISYLNVQRKNNDLRGFDMKEHRFTEASDQNDIIGEWKAEELFYELVKKDTVGEVVSPKNKKSEGSSIPTNSAYTQGKTERSTFVQQEENYERLHATKRVCESLDKKRNSEAIEAYEKADHEKTRAAQRFHDLEPHEQRQKESHELKESEKKRVQEDLERKLNETREEERKKACKQEHERKLKELNEQEEHERRLKETFEQEEKMKETQQRIENEKRQREAHERDEKERKQKAHERRLKETREKEENEKKEVDKRREALQREENERRQNEIRETEENEKRLKESYERQEKERRLKQAAEDERRLKQVEEEENQRRQKEACEKEENEKIQQALQRKENETRQQEARKIEENEKRLTEFYEMQEKERKQKQAAEERRLKQVLEMEDIQRRQKEYEREEYEKRLKESHEREQNERTLRQAAEESERRLQELITREKNEKREEEEKRLNKSFEREENELKLKRTDEEDARLEQVQELEENQRKQKECDREENQNRVKECHGKEDIERKLKQSAKEKERKVKRTAEENEMRLPEVIERRHNREYEREENEKRLKESSEKGNDKWEPRQVTVEKERSVIAVNEQEENEKRQKKILGQEDDKRSRKEHFSDVVTEKLLQEEACESVENEKKLRDPQELNESKLESHQWGEENKKSEEASCQEEIKETHNKSSELEENEQHNVSQGFHVSSQDKKLTTVAISEEMVECEDKLKSSNGACMQQVPNIEKLKVAQGSFEKVIFENLREANLVQSSSDPEECKDGQIAASMTSFDDIGMKLGESEDTISMKDDQLGLDSKDGKRSIKASQRVGQCSDDRTKFEAVQLINEEGKGIKPKLANEINTNKERKDNNFNGNFAREASLKEGRMLKDKELEKERLRKLEEHEREREREKDRIAVERVTEARERAFAEARERAERAAVERATTEARQRAMLEARERLEKACAEAREKSLAEKAYMESKLRAERAAVERATAEARERAVEKAIAERAAMEARERVERSVSEKFSAASRDGGLKQTSSFSDVRSAQFQSSSTFSSSQKYPKSSNHGASNEKAQGTEVESAQRCKARLERHQRTVERSVKALAEKNLRDNLAQRELAEKNRLGEILDADVKRWSSGKEGNLRALLSTLQYILGPESSWQPIPLTDIVTAAAVKKAYRKATLCVHPDKLQQRGASLQQKYVCEKVFDLLKDAWTKFNSEGR